MGVRSNPAKSPQPQYLPLPPLLPPMFSLLSSVPQQSDSMGSTDAHCSRRAKTRPALGLTPSGGLISMRAQLWGAAEPHLHPCWVMELQDTGVVRASQLRGCGGAAGGKFSKYFTVFFSSHARELQTVVFSRLYCLYFKLNIYWLLMCPRERPSAFPHPII